MKNEDINYRDNRIIRVGACEHFSKSDEVFPIKGSKDIDITDFTAVTNFVEKLKPNLVIHSAGVRDLDACEQQPERTYLINTLAQEIY